MNSPVTLSVKMFGAFRQYHQGTLSIEVPSGCDMLVVKSAIAQALQRANASFTNLELVNQSAIADHQHVYRDEELISTHATLAILPPVCGG